MLPIDEMETYKYNSTHFYRGICSDYIIVSHDVPFLRDDLYNPIDKSFFNSTFTSTAAISCEVWNKNQTSKIMEAKNYYRKWL